MRPELLENNLFWFAAGSGTVDVLYRKVDAAGTATDYTSIATLDTLTAPPATANLNADPLLDATWHLGASSPCIDQGTTSEAPTADFDGQARPMRTAIDIGPDELQ